MFKFISDFAKNRKKKKEIIAKAIKVAEKIFMKNNPGMAMKDGSFPKAGPDMPAAYNKEANRVEKQVVGTMLDQWKERQKRNLGE